MAQLVTQDDITLQSDGTSTWEINATYPVGGTYMGKFTFRCILTPMQMIEADRDYRDLLGKNAEFANTTVESYVYAISQLKQRVVFSPPFWAESNSRFPGSQVKDSEVLDMVLQAAIESELKYRAALAEKHEASISKLKLHIQKQKEAKAEEADLEKA
jgi:hypothetical protein